MAPRRGCRWRLRSGRHQLPHLPHPPAHLKEKSVTGVTGQSPQLQLQLQLQRPVLRRFNSPSSRSSLHAVSRSPIHIRCAIDSRCGPRSIAVADRCMTRASWLLITSCLPSSPRRFQTAIPRALQIFCGDESLVLIQASAYHPFRSSLTVFVRPVRTSFFYLPPTVDLLDCTSRSSRQGEP